MVTPKTALPTRAEVFVTRPELIRQDLLTHGVRLMPRGSIGAVARRGP